VLPNAMVLSSLFVQPQHDEVNFVQVSADSCTLPACWLLLDIRDHGGAHKNG
jgi:hypothetical protein